ncbi:MAG: hypothetical protein QOD83_1448 [Solirubrobacteraceae bacterium]|jgi:hypothetical protein|nr:hypothetical protein [Solirubrobacteraceae bacterium]
MSGRLQSSASLRDGVTFEVERLEISDGCLVISGHWSGVRGMRFVRPTLVAGGRRALATLEHKPWAPAPGKPWTAAFPWEGAEVEVDDLSLTVAPSVTVTLDPQSPADDETQPLVFVGASAPDHEPPPAPVAEEDGRAEFDDLQRRLEEAQALNASLDARCLELEQAVRRQQRKTQDAGEGHEDLEHARTVAQRDRDRALAQVEEAVQDREAALRTRARMEMQRDEAVRAHAAADARLAKAIADRDEAKAQRDEVLLAYRALQRQFVSERADADREQDLAASPRGDDNEFDGAAEADPKTPLGVRTVPAARSVMAELQRTKPESKMLLSQFDLWVMRVLGTVAALCFISLLVMILRVFI